MIKENGPWSLRLLRVEKGKGLPPNNQIAMRSATQKGSSAKNVYERIGRRLAIAVVRGQGLKRRSQLSIGQGRSGTPAVRAGRAYGCVGDARRPRPFQVGKYLGSRKSGREAGRVRL